MPRTPPKLRPLLLIVLPAITVALALPLAIRADPQLLALAPGGQLTVTCETSLSGVVEGQQATIACAPLPTPTATPPPVATATLPPEPAGGPVGPWIAELRGVSEGAAVSGPKVVIEAVPGGANIVSVVFRLDGPMPVIHTERRPPYFFLGDSYDLPRGWDTTQFPDGDYTMAVTASDAQGETSAPTVVHFRVSNAAPPAEATATPLPPTATPLPPTATPLPPTETPLPPVPTAAPPSPMPGGDMLESFEGEAGSWRTARLTAGNASLDRSSARAVDGGFSARAATTGGGSRAAIFVPFADAAASHQWNERPGTWIWQRASVFVPGATIAQLGGGEYLALAGFWPEAGGPYGWQLRLRQGGDLSVAGYTGDGAPAEFRIYGRVPVDRWFDLEIGLHSQAGPGVKRAFALLIDGQFYGWYRQGNMRDETFDRAAIGIVETNSARPLEVFLDQWRNPGTGRFPTGPDARPAANVQTQDFRNGSGVQVQYDWSTWKHDLRLDGAAGIYSAIDRLQAGRNIDRLPDVANGWAEIEIDWSPGASPPRTPNGYFGPMVGFRKEINREENLEIIPIGRGDGNVDLVFEAWVGNPVILARWPLPAAAAGGHIPEPGDIIRVRWEEASPGQLNVRASYYDASAGRWYQDIINGTYDITRVSDGSNIVNYSDGFHTASSITIDSPLYAIRRYTVGTLETYPR